MNKKELIQRFETSAISLTECEELLRMLIADTKAEDKPVIPSGFTAYDGSGQPVPDGVKFIPCTTSDGVWAMDRSNEDFVILNLLLAYKVTFVPTLTIDDVKKYHPYWFITSNGEIIDITFRGDAYDFALITANMAYASEELAECARSHKVYCEAYKKMLANIQD